MSVIQRVVDLLLSLPPYQIAIGLTALTALLAQEDRRLVLVSLLAQFILFGLLISPQIYLPVVFVRLGLGFAACLILYVTAGHVQGKLFAQPGTQDDEPRVSLMSSPSSSQPGMGVGFRLLVMLLGGLVAYNAWRVYPLDLIPARLNLVSYWLMSSGLLLMLTSIHPLRTGLGLLVFVNAFEGMYLWLEQSLLVVGLLGVVDVILALGIAVCSEAWLEGEVPER